MDWVVTSIKVIPRIDETFRWGSHSVHEIPYYNVEWTESHAGWMDGSPKSQCCRNLGAVRELLETLVSKLRDPRAGRDEGEFIE